MDIPYSLAIVWIRCRVVSLFKVFSFVFAIKAVSLADKRCIYPVAYFLSAQRFDFTSSLDVCFD